MFPLTLLVECQAESQIDGYFCVGFYVLYNIDNDIVPLSFSVTVGIYWFKLIVCVYVSSNINATSVSHD